ncbi:MAG: DNA gyrase subunit A [Alphaproteobacteria bacterium]|nr:DNA gyrase subunit A [Alphaproteobacteria bacterium]
MSDEMEKEIISENKELSDISKISIEDEMKQSYLDYAMSVIVSRALPDVRDGFKPVHRRILFAMHEGGYTSSKPFKKSARIVGDVMGSYHPHGDSAIYESMVRMAQDFSLRVPLVQGQGNFGSMDGDKAAAMRYTEARLAKVSESLLTDIEKNTVDFNPNYDGSIFEPSVLPARFPNLLVNGTGGIAVGMATNIPPHNLGEILYGTLALVDNRDLSAEELMEYVPAPDFPTGGIILGRKGSHSALTTGRGSVVMRAKCEIEEIRKDRWAIIVTEIPYQVNKARLIEKIAEIVNSKQVEGISDIRDESDRSGVRVVIELKRDAVGEVVLNQLYQYTQLQTSFGANMLAINKGIPQQMNLREILTAFIEFREEVITRRTIFDLNKSRNKAHTLVGLAVAVANIDDVIALIRGAKDPATARALLLEKDWPALDVAPLIELIAEPGREVVNGCYKMSEAQVKAILALQLHRLTGLERDKIDGELKGVCDLIKNYLEILSNQDKLIQILKNELIEVKEKYATPRKTEISDIEFSTDIESLIQREDMVITVSHQGYIKRVPLDTYKAQNRGGKGRTGMNTKDEDFVKELFVANTHTPLIFFTTKGIAYSMKAYKLPLCTPQSKGKAMVNILPLENGESLSAILALPEDKEEWKDKYLMFATAKGGVRRNTLESFSKIRSNGLIAMKLEEKDDELISVRVCDENQDILLASNNGRAIRFKVTDIRCFSSRNSTGVRGFRIGEQDKVISMSVLNHVDATSEERRDYIKFQNAIKRGENPNVAEFEHISEEKVEYLSETDQQLLVISSKGYGMKASIHDYRLTNRGGKGIGNMEVNERNGDIVASFIVDDNSQIMLVTDAGQMIRTKVDSVRQTSRNSKGVKVFTVKDKENVISVAHIPCNEETDECCSCGCIPEECDCDPECDCGCNSTEDNTTSTTEA